MGLQRQGMVAKQVHVLPREAYCPIASYILYLFRGSRGSPKQKLFGRVNTPKHHPSSFDGHLHRPNTSRMFVKQRPAAKALEAPHTGSHADEPGNCEPSTLLHIIATLSGQLENRC